MSVDPVVVSLSVTDQKRAKYDGRNAIARERMGHHFFIPHQKYINGSIVYFFPDV